MSRLAKRLGLALLLILTLLALVLAGATLYAASRDNDDWRDILEYWVARETGTRLTIAGDFSFVPSWHPTLTAGNVTLEGGDPTQPEPLLSLGRLEISASLKDLLRGVVHVERLRLADGTFHIRLHPEDPRGEAPGAERRSIPLVLGDAEFDDVHFIVHPTGGGRSTELSLDRFTVAEQSAQGPLSVEGKGLLNGYPLSIDGRLGPIAEFLKPTRPYDIDLAVELAEAKSILKGTVADPIKGQGVSLEFSVHLDELAEFLRLFYHQLPPIGSLAGEGRLSGDFDRLSLQAASLSVGDDAGTRADVRGEIADVTHFKGVDLHVEADLRNGEPWQLVLAPKLPSIHTAHVKGHLTDAAGRLGVEGLDLRVGGKKFAAEITGRVGNLQADGPFPVADLDLSLSAQTQDLSIWSKLAGRALPPAGPLTLSARIGDRDGAPRLEDVDLQLGPAAPSLARLTGRIDRITPEARPPVSGVEMKLVLDAPRLSDLTGFAEKPGRDFGPVVGSGSLSDKGGSLNLAAIDIQLGKGREIVRVTGRVDDLVAFRGVELAGDITLSELSVLDPLVGRELPALGPVKGTFRMDDRDGVLRADPLDFHIGSRETAWIDLTGHIDDVVHFRKLDLNADVSLQNLTDLAPLVGRDLPSIGPVRGVATLTGSEKALALTKIECTLGQPGHDWVRVTGTVGDLVSMREVDLTADLVLDRLPVLAPLVGRDLPDIGPVKGSFQVEDSDGVLAASAIHVAVGSQKTMWLQLSGGIGDLLKLSQVEIAGEARVAALPHLDPLVGHPLPDLGPFQATAQLTDRDGSLGVDGLQIEGGRKGLFSVRLSGDVSDLRALNDIQLDLALSAKDLAGLSGVLDRALPPTGPVDLTARLIRSKEDLQLQGAKLAIGRSRIEGSARYVDAAPRPRFTAKLHAPFLDMRDLGLGWKAPPGQATGDPAAPEAGATGKGEPQYKRRWLFGSERFPLHRLRTFDLDGEIRINHLAAFRESLDEVAVSTQIEGGRLEAHLTGHLVHAGSQKASMVVDAREEEAAISLDYTATDWNLGTFSQERGVEDVQKGRLDAKLNLTGHGDSLRELAASLNGEATIAVTDGQLRGRRLNLLAEGLATKLFLDVGHKSTPVDCAAAHFKATNGRVVSPAIAMETDRVTIIGRGFIDFREEKLHIVFDPKPRHPSLFSLQVPVMITGTFAKPVVKTGTWETLLKKVAEAAGLALIDPLAAVLPFVDLGLSNHHACEKLLHESGLSPPESEKKSLE